MTTNARARELAHRSKGALLRPGGATQAYYQTAGLSYGLHMGAPQYGYALFLMNENAISDLDTSGGREIGSGPSIVVIDNSVSASLSTTHLNANAYAVFFNQNGLMAGLGLQGSKITRIHPNKN